MGQFLVQFNGQARGKRGVSKRHKRTVEENSMLESLVRKHLIQRIPTAWAALRVKAGND
jgi:hypothetical protein